MTDANINTVLRNATYSIIYNAINEIDFCESVIKETNGFYEINKALSANEFVVCAKYLLNKIFAKGSEGITSTKSCKDYFITALSTCENEHVVALFLDAENHAIAYEIVALGTINRATVYPRTIVKKALMHNAAAVVIAHNHVSGNYSPSPDDYIVTQKVHDALDLIDTKLLDHIIVSNDGKALSFAEEKLMP